MFFYKTAFYVAVEKENIDIIKLLLSNDKIDVNIPCISLYFFLNRIINQILKLDSKSCISITFKRIYFNHI